jgi:succinate dehydrogenase / fumarate reductase cytochrome b subunit
LTIHISNFWIPSRLGGIGHIHELNIVDYNGKEYHDLYGEMRTVFQIWWIDILYIVGCISLAYHLAHGFQSSFKTLGVYNKRYQKILRCIGYAFAIIVPLAFIIMPISFYLGWIN